MGLETISLLVAAGLSGYSGLLALLGVYNLFS